VRGLRAHLAVLLISSAAIWPTQALGHELEARCREFGLLAPVCDGAREVEQGLARTGVSAADFTDDPVQEIEITDFYFAPRIVQVFDRTRIVFRNTNPTGGNRHSLSSSDLGSDHRVLPLIPEFGAGQGFDSNGLLQPGDVFVLDIDIAAMDPVSYLPTGLGDYWIGYHCYVHGAAQMSGLIRVLPRT
jgi:hypothetical protein